MPSGTFLRPVASMSCSTMSPPRSCCSPPWPASSRAAQRDSGSRAVSSPRASRATAPKRRSRFERDRISRMCPRWLNGPWDARSRLAVILDLRARGVDAYPSPNRLEQMAVYRAGGAGLSLYPLGGIANVPTVFCNESGAFANYASFGDGFNNPPSGWRDGAADVVGIGDSFAHGACGDT